MEEFVKYSILMKPHFELFGDRFSERAERRAKAAKAAEKVDAVEKSQLDKPLAAGIDQGVEQKDGKVKAGAAAADVVNGVRVAGL